MSERSDLLDSIAETIKDYRAGELAQPTPDHVDRWIGQFDQRAQVPMLRELHHVFGKTYFSKADVMQFYSRQINNAKLAGETPPDFWRAAHFLDIQLQGHSQTEIRALFGAALKEQHNLGIDGCGSKGGPFIYLDDALFSGGRVGSDLSVWIANHAPVESTVHIAVIATHRFGEYKCKDRLRKAADAAGKDLQLQLWAAMRFENRLKYRNQSEVLWPAELPEDGALQEYVAEEEKFPFQPREPGGKLQNSIFSCEEGRQLLERELLLAGMRIRSFSQNPSPALRPLGFSPFGLGFGSMVVTFRNCPNNTPLALWWGNPEAASGHPLSMWYPLLPRKTYESEVDVDEIDF
jgi:hypothetical protein